MAIVQNPHALHGKSVSEMLREDLAAVGNSITLLLIHLLLPFSIVLDKISSAVKKEILIYRQERYIKSHQADIFKAHQDLKEKALLAVRYNHQGQDWQHVSISPI